MLISSNQKSNYLGRRICIKYTPEEISSFKKKIRSEFYSFLGIKTTPKGKSKLDEDSHILTDEVTKIYFTK